MDASVGIVKKTALTAWEGFWYVLMCINFGAGYLAKVPVKKALQDADMGTMTAAESFWYVLMCLCFGTGYFIKVPVAKALAETALTRHKPAGIVQDGTVATGYWPR